MATYYRPMKKHSTYPVQGKKGKGDAPGTSKFSCSACRIDYTVKEGNKGVCPLCDAHDQMDSLRDQVHSLAQEVQMLQEDLRRARNASSLVETMRDALSVATPDDVANIKAVAYRWRSDPGKIAVKPARMTGGKKTAIEVVPRTGESEFFVPTSVGGVVFVESYEALVKACGMVKAMEQYAQAIAGRLAA